ncbi:MAG TPA: class I SAM-dependent rRNA methyltransferase [Pseudomonadales bacterium]|nr:class I SAM-dependent rRNA methyltransferase [Pseudomonadales bacterium]
MIQTLKLRPREDKRLRQGHVWIYSNEVDTSISALKSFTPGEEVVVLADSGKPLGRALVSPNSLICARLVSRDPDVGLDAALLGARLDSALALRERLYPGTGCYRLVFGEGDGLSGMVVDRYGDVLVCQLATAGMEVRKDMVVDALRKSLAPRTIVFKHDSGAREVEGLEQYVEIVGEDPGALVPLTENGVPFRVPVTGGQKTGWFYDHRENRARLAPFCAGARVLDAFSYVGGWGLQALAFGAESATVVDSSAPALEVLETNAADLGVADAVTVQRGDGFDVLAGLADAGERFGIVIVDPPALIKRRKDLKAGERAYERLAQSALRLVADDGLVVFGSCSLHLQRDTLREIIRGAARHTERQVQVLGVSGAGPDHPVHPAIPESDYLKAAFLRVRTASRGGVM